MRKKVNKKLIVALLSFVLLFGGTFGSSLAWLLDNTEDVTNTFSASNIEVSLEETEEDFKMVPGWAIDKDPKASVSSESEDCYLFVKIEESGVSFVPEGEVMPLVYAFNDFVKYEITDEWIELDGEPGVYYRIIDDTTEKNVAYSILGEGTYEYNDIEYAWSDNQVLTRPEVTKEMMEKIGTDNAPKLSFTAYAVQLWKTNKPANGASEEEDIEKAQFSPTEAWALAQNLD